MRSDKSKAMKRQSKQKKGFFPKSPVLFIIMLLVFLTEAVFLLLISALDILPGKYAALVLIILLVLTLLCIKLLGCRKKNTMQRKAGVVVSLMMIVTLGIGCYYLFNTYDTLGKISRDRMQTEDFYVVALKEGSYTDLKDIDGETVFVIKQGTDTYKNAKKQLVEEVDVSYKNTEDYIKLGQQIIDDGGKTHDNIIFLSETNYRILCEDTEKFEESTKIIHTVTVEFENKDIAKRLDVTKDSFSVYISGIDTYGGISNVSRSDVNMIMTVNPETREILLTSIPRDMYVPLHSYGAMDKLTHSGIYGVEETITTVEDWLDIEINYFIRVNFSTLVDIVDALGGVDVESDQAFTTVSGYSFSAGTNHVSGEEALAFARERKAFAAGDRVRVENQQRVLSGIINKITGSSAILTSYAQLLNAIEDEMQTNMTSNDISRLVKMQLGDMRGWNIESISVTGQGASEPTYSMGSVNLYVMIPDEASVSDARAKIGEVMSGY